MLHATKINERAWIVPVIGIIEPNENPDKFQIKVELRNNGKTPAWITAAGSNGKGATDQLPLSTKPPYDEMKPFTKKTVPWHETHLFWGCFTLSASLVLVAVAATLRDFRWVLIPACLLACVS